MLVTRVISGIVGGGAAVGDQGGPGRFYHL